MSIVSICFICYSSVVTTCPSTPAARFVFVYVLFVLFLFFVVILSGEPKQNQGRGLVDRKLVQAPQQFHCWPSKGDSSVLVLSLVILDVACCYVWLFSLYIHIQIGKNSC